MIEELPCTQCRALCCGPVPLSHDRLETIRDFVKKLPFDERKRLARQHRHMFDCAFLDKKNYRCAIYPVRPWICEAFGRTPGLPCIKTGDMVQQIPQFLANDRFEIEYRSGKVGTSSRFNWLER
jgi:uncharacterized protein